MSELLEELRLLSEAGILIGKGDRMPLNPLEVAILSRLRGKKKKKYVKELRKKYRYEETKG